MTIAVMIIKLLIWLPEPTSLRHVKPEPLSPTWSAPKVGIAGARACNELFSIKKLRASQQLALGKSPTIYRKFAHLLGRKGADALPDHSQR
jgi:hypothetical protein